MINFRYPYGEKGGIRSSSIVVSDELKDAIDSRYGNRQRSAFLERAGWLLLGLLENDRELLDDLLKFAHGRMKMEDIDAVYDGLDVLMCEL